MRCRGNRARRDTERLRDLGLRQSEDVTGDDDGALPLGEPTQHSKQVNLLIAVAPDASADELERVEDALTPARAPQSALRDHEEPPLSAVDLRPLSEGVLERVLHSIGRVMCRVSHRDEPSIDRGVRGLAANDPVLPGCRVERRFTGDRRIHPLIK